MEHSFGLKVIGVVFLIAGLVLSYNPELVSNKPIPSDPFKAVERRIWWGLLIGFGLFALLHHQLHPVWLTLAAMLSTLVLGIIITRVMGIVLDGSTSKQWQLVGIEAVVLIGLLLWYLRLRGGSS
jgi:hypothetical protein